MQIVYGASIHIPSGYSWSGSSCPCTYFIHNWVLPALVITATLRRHKTGDSSSMRGSSCLPTPATFAIAASAASIRKPHTRPVRPGCLWSSDHRQPFVLHLRGWLYRCNSDVDIAWWRPLRLYICPEKTFLRVMSLVALVFDVTLALNGRVLYVCGLLFCVSDSPTA